MGTRGRGHAGRVEGRNTAFLPSLIKPCMRFSRTRLSDVLHTKACAFARPALASAAEDVAPVHSTIERVTIGGFLLGLGIELPL